MLLDEGYQVAAFDVRESALTDLKNKIGNDKVYSYVVDVSLGLPLYAFLIQHDGVFSEKDSSHLEHIIYI